MKSKYIMMLLFIGMIAACKKDNTTTPNGNGGNGNNNGNNTTEHGTGVNRLTLTIGNETPLILKGENELFATYGLRVSMYEYSLGYHIAIHAEGDFPVEVDLVGRRVYSDVNDKLGRYFISQGDEVVKDKNFPQEGRNFILDSGRVEITSIEPLGNGNATIKGTFNLWTESSGNKVEIKGEIDAKESDYELP